MQKNEREFRNPQVSEKSLKIFQEEEQESAPSYHWSDTKNLGNSFTLVGKNTYVIGAESGRYEGRWNGVWSLPIKIADRVHFAITDGTVNYPLYAYAKEFVTKLSHVERSYEIAELGLKIKELMFIPENSQSICWRFVIKTDGSREFPANVRLIAECDFNLMWEVKQAGEQFKTRKEIILYNEDHCSVVARHNRHSDWIGIFGASRQPTGKHFGITDFGTSQRIDTAPEADKPFYGNVSLEYALSGSSETDAYATDFCLTGGCLSYLEAVREFNDTMMNFEMLAMEKTSIYQSYLSNTSELRILPEDALTRAFRWSKINLHMLEHYQPGFGTGTFAGLPHFAIYFGRDISWSTLGLLSMGDFELAKENLNLLARFQAREDGEDMLREPFYRGEIPHEIRTEGTTYYYSADSTPLFVVAAKRYLDWTKDIGFIKFLYTNIVSAVDWSIDADRDGDGFIEHGPEGFLIDTTWMDSYYRGKSAVDVQAIYCRALFDASYIASAVGDDSHAGEWQKRAARLKTELIEKYWDSSTNFFYDTIEPSGRPNNSLTINSIVPVLFDLTDHDKSIKILNRIASSEFMTDWGVRTRSNRDPEYDPRSYQRGGVWPFCTGWVALAQFQHGLYSEGISSIRRFIKGLDMGSNYFKEVLYGDLPPAGQHPVQPTGCFIQAWSAGMFLLGTIEGLLGISPGGYGDASLPTVKILPFLGRNSEQLEMKNVRIGDRTFVFDLRMSREKEVTIKLTNRGPGSSVVDSGFVIQTDSSAVRPKGNSGISLEDFSQSKNLGYLKAEMRAGLTEGETREFTFETA